MATSDLIGVCHIVSGDAYSGSETRVCGLLRALEKDPAVSLQLIVFNEGELSERAKKAGISTTIIDETKHSFLSLIREVNRCLRDFGSDILHTHRYKENIIGAFAEKKGGEFLRVQTYHPMTAEESRPWLERAKTNLKWAMSHAASRVAGHQVVCVTAEMKEKLSSYFPHNRLSVIRNALVVEDLELSKSASEMKQGLGIKEDELLIGCAGRLLPPKGFDVFLQAAKIISEEISHARFVVVGDGPERVKLERLARELNLDERVSFLGLRRDIIELINSFDLYCINSRHEGITLALLQAMYFQVPVVATPVGGVVEVLKDGESAFFSKPDDPEEFARVCIEVLRGRRSVVEVTRNARQLIEHSFTDEYQKQQMLDLYRALLKRQ